MKRFNLFVGILAVTLMEGMSSCKDENINSYGYAAKTDTTTISTGDANTVKTATASYPTGSVVWSHDTTLTSSFKIPAGASLYTEPGVKVTANSKPLRDHPIEIVTLGGLYAVGMREKPVVISSDTGKPNDQGDIVCGYNCGEVMLNHTGIAHAGATPTESSLSFQSKLFKTTINDGIPTSHFCNTKGRFTIVNCFFHDNYDGQAYLTGGNGIIYGSVFADSGNESDGGEAINVKSGYILDIVYSLIYNVCTNAFRLSGSGVEKNFTSKLVIYNNTTIDYGWRRTKNKGGGNVWIEKAIMPAFVNNLMVDNHYGICQPGKGGAGIDNNVLSPNYFFASTNTRVKQQSRDFKMIVWDNNNLTSQAPEDLSKLFIEFTQNDKMNINCKSSNPANGAPLKWNSAWDFHLQPDAPQLTGALSTVKPNFPSGLAFFSMKKVKWVNNIDDQDYYFPLSVASSFFGTFGAK